MARYLDEQLEAVGYDQIWSETVGGGNTVDEDFATSSVTGAQADWDDKCLKCIGLQGVTSAFAETTDFSATGDFFGRVELNIGSLPGVAAQTIYRWMDGFNNVVNIVLLNTGVLTLESYHDGSKNTYTALTTLSINTQYRVELKWNATANLWAWRLGGVDQPNDQDASDPVTSEGLLTATHRTSMSKMRCGPLGQSQAITIYFDNIALDNADWVGAEVPEITMIGPGMMMGVGT